MFFETPTREFLHEKENHGLQSHFRIKINSHLAILVKKTVIRGSRLCNQITFSRGKNLPFHNSQEIKRAFHGSRKNPLPPSDIRLARTQTSAVSEHANETGHLPIWKEVKFIDRDPHWYTRRVKEAIHVRLNPNNINRDSGIEIPEAWIPTITKHNSRPERTTKRTCEGTTSNSRNNNEDRNAPIAASHHATNSDT